MQCACSGLHAFPSALVRRVQRDLGAELNVLRLGVSVLSAWLRLTRKALEVVVLLATGVMATIALVLVAGKGGRWAVEFQQPGDKQPQQEKPLTKSQDIIPGQEKKDEGASSVQGEDPQADFQQPGDKQPQQEKPLTKSQDIIPGQEKKDEGASSVQGPALEANQQELAQPKTGCGCGDGSDVKRKRLPNPEPIKEPEAGFGSQTFVRNCVAGSEVMLKTGVSPPQPGLLREKILI
ncbi:PREDICTED: P antigen family member 1-like [Lipotes vexillifer]|uniref:P antigen family member 1-like n=1 Tax=Lipotes vexillifer TaxID=118797 RepID=A0A340WQA9_LIPVE|nr:PREDICTED: P antigen family member 1-like [Lipotes vexillifer]